MYVKDSIIEARIEKDLKKEHLKGRIEEAEHQLGKSDTPELKKRLKKLRGDLELLQD